MREFAILTFVSLALAGCDRSPGHGDEGASEHGAPIDRAPAEPDAGAGDEERTACESACELAVAAECAAGPGDGAACVTACELDQSACDVGGSHDYAAYLDCVAERGLACGPARQAPLSQECVMEAFRGVGVVCAQSGDVGTRKPHCGTACALAVDAGCESGPRDLEACIEECTAERTGCPNSWEYDAYFTCILEDGFVCDGASGAPTAEACRQAAFADGTCSARTGFGVPAAP